MNKTDRQRKRDGERARRKRLIRPFREDEQARIWNKIVDEVGGYNLDDPEWECYTFDFLDHEPDPDFTDPDEPYPNKTETMHNLFDCD